MRSTGIRADVESYKDRFGRACQLNIVLSDRTHTTVNDFDLDFLIAQAGKCFRKSFDRTLNVSLDNKRQLFNLRGLGDHRRKLFQSQRTHTYGCRAGGSKLFAPQPLTSFFRDLSRLHVAVENDEVISRSGGSGSTDNLDGDARPRLNYGIPVVGNKRTHLAENGTADESVSLLQGAVLHEHGDHRPAAAIELGLNDCSYGTSVPIGLQFQDLRLEIQALQQLIQPLTRMRGDTNNQRLSAPLFRRQPVFRKLTQHAVRIAVLLVYLVYGHDNRHIRRFGVVDRFNSLRHNTVIRRNHKHDDIRNLGASSTHGGKSLVAGGIEKSHRPAAGDPHIVSADMLCNSAYLGSGYSGLSDCIQKRRFAVINVPHHCNDGRPQFQHLFSFRAGAQIEILFHVVFRIDC